MCQKPLKPDGKHVLQQEQVSPRVFPCKQQRQRCRRRSQQRFPTICLAARVTVILRLPRSYTTDGGTTMNSEEKSWRWGKRKDERSPNQFLERNGEDRRRRALVSLLFSSLLFSSLLFSSSPSPLSFLDLVTAKGGAGRGDGLGFTNGMYSMRSMQPQCPFVQSSNGSKKLILAINFVYSHVESVFCPFFILSVTEMQTLMIFWSSWCPEMIVSERQQDPPSCPLLVPSKVGQIRLLIRKSLWLVPYLSCHSLKQRDSSISLNELSTIPLHNYLTHSWDFLAVSLSWAVEN